MNTAQNAVQLRHIPTGLVLKVSEGKYFEANGGEQLFMMVLMD